MQKRPFGSTGLQVSPLGFGAAPAAFLKTDQPQLAKMLQSLLDSGMNVIDTAAMYPGSEEFIGKYLSARRKDYVLISKCGTKVAGIDEPLWSAGLISKSIDQALKLLKTDVIDLMLLHSCDLATFEKGEALGSLLAAKRAGKIRFAGYSGDNDVVAIAAKHPDVSAVEMSINIADQANIENGLKVAHENDKGVIAKRPIANAAWKDISTQQGMYKNYAKVYTERLAKMKLDPATWNLSWPELALRFTLSQPGVSTAIIGTTNPTNAAANVMASSKGPLDESTLSAIRSSFESAKGSEEWSGQT